jgi:WhiB family transcriptional regulator, redox-sensing transcriptional regulator
MHLAVSHREHVMPLAHDQAGTSERNAPELEATRSATWRDEAACLHPDPDLFFPISTTGPARRQIDEAKCVCQACPVRTPCLDWALNNSVPYGVWGGTTEEERRANR